MLQHAVHYNLHTRSGYGPQRLYAPHNSLGVVISSVGTHVLVFIQDAPLVQRSCLRASEQGGGADAKVGDKKKLYELT